MTLLKCIVVAIENGIDQRVDFKAAALCNSCSLVSEVDMERGRLTDLGLSFSVLFERQSPRLVIVATPLLHGRDDS